MRDSGWSGNSKNIRMYVCIVIWICISRMLNLVVLNVLVRGEVV